MSANGGILHLDDLAQIPWPIERRPVSGRFEGMRVFTFPPPGAGRTLLEILHILSQFQDRTRRPDTARSLADASAGRGGPTPRRARSSWPR